MKNYTNQFLIVISLLFIAITACLTVSGSRVQAQGDPAAECPNEQFLGRQMCEGFLSGDQRTYGSNQNVFYDGLHVNDVDTFVSTIRGYLDDNDKSINPGNYWADVRDYDSQSNNAGSATIIAVMLGKNGSDFNNISQGVAYAKANFARWESMVRYYDSLGRIQWSVLAVSNDSQGGRVKHTSGDKPSTDNYFLRTPFFTTQVIRFDALDGDYFQIQRDCGNIFGLIGDLEEPPTTPPPTTPPPSMPPPPPNPPPVNENQPYFEVNGGDVSAGAGISVGGNECAATGGVQRNDNAGIVGWNQGASSYGGAGTQYAGLALGHLQGFATGQGSSLAPSRLSFANTGGTADQVNPGRQLYGGEFGGLSCVADYFANATPATTQTGQVVIGAQAIPNCAPAVPVNQCRRTIYVDGNVHINGNITFTGSYANAFEIPSFSIIVRGNIYIAPGVTQLDGFYIAQPTDGTSTDGIIYTCAPSNFTPATLTSDLQAACGTALTVNGAFVARQVWLLRTAGTLNTTAAETFNYVPEMWVNTPFDSTFTTGGTDDYDAITSLPPVL